MKRFLSRLPWRAPVPPSSERPILALDIDGVLSLFGFDGPPDPGDFKFHVVGGTMHCFSIAAGRRVHELAQDFDVVWATGWEHEVAQLSELLDFPKWPYLTFRGEARFGTADWKLAPLEKYARGRSLAWVDDNLDQACYAWARGRPEPTLLVEVEPQAGLQPPHVEALKAWARSLAAERSVG